MKRRIRDVCRNRRGEGYIDVAIGIFCLMLVVALAMTLFPVFMKKQQLDSFADENSQTGRNRGEYGCVRQDCTVKAGNGT